MCGLLTKPAHFSQVALKLCNMFDYNGHSYYAVENRATMLQQPTQRQEWRLISAGIVEVILDNHVLYLIEFFVVVCIVINQ